MWAFARAVVLGTVAAAILPLCLTIPLALFDDWHPATSLYVAALPLIVAFPVVLGASILIGIPAFLLLRSRRAETIENYLGVGVVAGLVLPLLVILPMGSLGGVWTCLFGAVGGGVTAEVWARWREKATGRPTKAQVP